MPSESPPDGSGRGPAYHESLLQSGEHREAIKASHPLTTDTLQIATPAVREVYAAAHHAIINSLPGTNFVGDPRIGKTRTQKIIARMLEHQHPDIPVGQVIALPHDHMTESRMWSDLGESLGLAIGSSRDYGKARSKVLNAIVTECRDRNSGKYVLLCDEAHEWGESAWSYLRALANLTERKKIRMITIGFAHDQLHHVRNLLRQKNRKDLVSRFMKRIDSISGIRDLADLTTTVQQLDNPRFDYPTHSGICCAEFFMPHAYASGWRPSDEVAYFWAAFDVVSRRVAHRPASNVGMSSVVLALKEYFLICEREDSPTFRGGRQTWLRAVENAKYADDLM